jgi:zinc/manganese transport system substrate-binding protein
VDLSAGVELRDVPAARVDRSMGDVHAYGNPHYPLSLANGQRMVATLAKAMAAADPPNAAAYRENAVRVVTELGALRDELRQRFAPYAGLKVVTFHPAWAYLADTLPVEIAGTIEPQPAVTPSAQQVRDLVGRMREQGVRVVIVETYSDDNLAAAVARQAGAQLVKVPDHVNGQPEVKSYQDLFRHAAEQLIAAAKAAGVEPKPQ